MITKVHSAGVVVADQDAALDFYVNTLGWEKRADAPVSEDYRWLTVAPVGGDAEVALEPPSISNRQPGATGISLNVDDIDGTFSELAGRGVTFVDEAGNKIDAPQTMPWGAKAAWMRDPDGNTYFFIEALGSDQSSDRRT